jgi:hypothetical protein
MEEGEQQVLGADVVVAEERFGVSVAQRLGRAGVKPISLGAGGLSCLVSPASLCSTAGW